MPTVWRLFPTTTRRLWTCDGVLGAEFIWQEDLNKIQGLNAMVKQFLDLIQEKGMLEAVKTIL